MPSGCSAFLGTQRQASRGGAGLLSFQPPSSPGGLWVALPPCWAQLGLLHFPSIAPLKALSPQQLHLGTVERGGTGTENRCLSWEVTGVCNMRMPIVTQQEWCRPCTPLDRSVRQHLGSHHAETARPYTALCLKDAALAAARSRTRSRFWHFCPAGRWPGADCLLKAWPPRGNENRKEGVGIQSLVCSTSTRCCLGVHEDLRLASCRDPALGFGVLACFVHVLSALCKGSHDLCLGP